MEKVTELLTARELAKRLRISPDTVRDWARRGKIPKLRLSRKVIRYNAEAVLAAIANAAKEVSRG